MQVTIDPAGLAFLQASRLAIALARPSPSPDVGSALAFALDAANVIGRSFAVTVQPELCCFVTSGLFNPMQTVTPALLSASIDRAAIGDTGAVASFDGSRLDLGTSDAVPGMLLVHNGGRNDNVTIGLAETFANTADNATAQAPTLLRALARNTIWALDELPTDAWLFTISASTPVGTIVPSQFFVPKPLGKATRAKVSVTASTALRVDLSDESLKVTYNAATHRFVPG